MIEGSDCDCATQRFTHCEDLAGFSLSGNVSRKNLAIIPQNLHRGKAEHIQGSANFVPGFPQRESGLRRDRSGKLITARFKRTAGSFENL
jgi:hypothetical protein